MSEYNPIQQDVSVMEMLEGSVIQILRKNGMLQGNKTFGFVAEILNDKSLMVEMTQSNSIEKVGCSPNMEFRIGDRVMVEYINNNPHDRFVVAIVANGIDTDTSIDDEEDDKDKDKGEGDGDKDCYDYTFLPYEPVEIIRYEDSRKAYKFIYGYDNPDTTWEQELIRNEDGKVVEIIHRYPNGVELIRVLYRNDRGEVYKYE